MKNWTTLFLQETLDKNRIKLLDFFVKIKEMWFYLAWGTALALQLWHRQSIDFDFFINSHFDENELFEKTLEIFKWLNIKKIFTEKDTLYIEVEWIKISFFSYKYYLVKKMVETPFFNLASIEDIWSMKLWAIQKRSTNKDYVDIFYILQKINLKTLIAIFYEKFSYVISTQLILKSLVYFDDIVEEKLILNDKKLTFNKVKKSLIELVRDYN